VQILDLKWNKCKQNPLIYYVCWAGYKGIAEEYSWLEAINATKLVLDFHALNPGKPRPDNILEDT